MLLLDRLCAYFNRSLAQSDPDVSHVLDETQVLKHSFVQTPPVHCNVKQTTRFISEVQANLLRLDLFFFRLRK
jgi:hypothetical protein